MRILNRLFLLTLCVVCTILTYQCITFDNLTIEDENKYLLSGGGKCVYSLDTINTIKVNLSGFSNSILKLESEGFRVYEIKVDNTSIDVIIQNNDLGIVYRYYYTYPDRRLTCFCNTYENSYKALTYIIE